ELPCVTEEKSVLCAWTKDGNIHFPTERYNYSQMTQNGDCSLTIRKLDFLRDNGLWECQVPSKIEVGKDPKWPKASVVVLVKPSQPVIEFDVRRTLAASGRVMTHISLQRYKIFEADKVTKVSCR